MIQQSHSWGYIWRKRQFEKLQAPPCSLQHYLQSPRYGMAKCPLTEEWIKKMWHVYTMEYYSAIKKNEIMPFAATWMDLEIIILSEVSQRKRWIVYDITYMWNLKRWYKWTYLQNKQTHRHSKLMFTKGERGVGEGKIRRLGLTYTHYYI